MAEMTRVDFPQFAVRELVYAAGRRMARHAHEYSNVTVVVSGDLEETTDDGEHRGRSCSVLLKPAGTMHANYAVGRQGTRTVSVEMPGLSPLAQELQSLQWQWLEDPETARAGLALYRAFRGGSRAELEARALAVVAAATSTASRTAAGVPRWLDSVKAMLAERFDAPLRFEDLAAEVGLHPVYLSRAFRRHTGMAMGEYVRSLRLRHARHLLSATERSLAAISAEAGFADASHLCRLFSATHELTPKAFRALCGAGAS
jgi:AraC family transcriptional regulator